MREKPELLAPAKNLERLKVAVSYGADAVYVGGQRYGLRARADNLTRSELEEAVAFCHDRGARLYITLNAFLHDDDFEGLAEYSRWLEAIGVDAVIVSDLGVLRQVQEASGLDIHLSTQASCLNASAARMWKRLGAARLILGRELTVEEGGRLRTEAGVEVEMFIHGAMCMAFSGRCTISNFTAGRDSNRGGCSQSCRFSYETPEAVSGTLLSSKDLQGIHQLPAMFEQGICSLKIEGRMKSAFYVATTCQTYRRLIDAYAAGEWSPELLQWATEALSAAPHRDFFSGSLDGPAGPDSVFWQEGSTNVGSHRALGQVLEVDEQRIVLHLKAPLRRGDAVEFLPFGEAPVGYRVESLHSALGEAIEASPQDSVAWIARGPELASVQALNVLRARHNPQVSR